MRQKSPRSPRPPTLSCWPAEPALGWTEPPSPTSSPGGCACSTTCWPVWSICGRRVFRSGACAFALPCGVLRALEDPPLGGPVAGIAAGLDVLGRSAPVAGLAGILTCDAPLSWRALPALHRALAQTEPELDGVCARDGEHTQYLLGLYRRRALAASVAPGGTPLRDTAVRRALGTLRVRAIPTARDVVRDLDTWAEVHSWDSGRSE